MIEVMNVSKQYGDKKVVDDVSITIEPGKVTSFIGPNGAGKSTLLSMISRLMDKENGEIIISGKEIEAWDTKELAKELSILKQSNDIHIRLTVRELVAFGRFPYSQSNLTKEDMMKIDEALDFMELNEIADSYLDDLSGGQRQRAYIAMVIAQDTEYILLDEPLNNLDIKHSLQMMKVLRRLAHEKGKTIVIVLHDINFSASYSDKIVAMKDGKVVISGEVKDVIQTEVLREIYGIKLRVEDFETCKVCIYN